MDLASAFQPRCVPLDTDGRERVVLENEQPIGSYDPVPDGQTGVSKKSYLERSRAASELRTTRSTVSPSEGKPEEERSSDFIRKYHNNNTLHPSIKSDTTDNDCLRERFGAVDQSENTNSLSKTLEMNVLSADFGLGEKKIKQTQHSAQVSIHYHLLPHSHSINPPAVTADDLQAALREGESDLSQLDDAVMFGDHDDDDSEIRSTDMMENSLSSARSKNSHTQLSFADDSDFPDRWDRSTTPPASIDLDAVLKVNGGLIPQPQQAYNVPLSTNSSKSNTPSKSAVSTSSSGKPVLYSAIGSLETCSANSFGKIRSQYRNFASRDFSRPNETLIPPKSAEWKSVIMKPVATKSVGTMKEILSDSDLKAHAQVFADESNEWEQIAQQGGAGRENRATNGAAELTEPPKQQQAVTTKEKTTKKSKESYADPGGNHRSRREPKKVTIKESTSQGHGKKKTLEMFRPSCDAYTPRVEKKKIEFKPAKLRTPVQKMSSTMGTLARPNFRDALRRVAMILRQHIVKIEKRFEEAQGGTLDGLFRSSMKEAFSETKYATPKFKCTIVRLPMARPGMVYGLREVKPHFKIPTEEEIYEFGHQLFKSVQLSSECSIVCLIYVERLMEVAKVPLVASTWRPIFMCGLLLASKVWQDLSSWNIEFATVYPQFSLNAINKLELHFLRMVKWDLYISSSLYAKYYFALRSLLEKNDFRQRYNRMVGGVGNVSASDALKVQQRSEQVKEEALLQLSRSV